MTIQPIEFSDALSSILEEYSHEIQENVNKAVLKTGEKALKTVRQKSPTRKSKRYRKGWTMKKGKTGVGGRNVSVTIYNRKMGSFTHVIEKGHQKPTGGRTVARPHIQPAYEEAERTLEREVQAAIEEAGT